MNKNQRAKEDLKDKHQLEALLLIQLNHLFNLMQTDFKNNLAIYGELLDFSIYLDHWEKALHKHYQRVIKKFRYRMSDQIDIDITDDEKTTINNALSIYSIDEAKRQAKKIIETTKKNSDFALASAQAQKNQYKQETGKVMPNHVFAGIAGNILRRLFIGRKNTIAITETSHTAETAKFTEVQVIEGIQPTINNRDSNGNRMPSITSATLLKDWVAVLDDATRESHVIADGTQKGVDFGKPFHVGDSFLMFPHDRSLGASIKEWINCRCCCIYRSKRARA